MSPLIRQPVKNEAFSKIPKFSWVHTSRQFNAGPTLPNIHPDLQPSCCELKYRVAQVTLVTHPFWQVRISEKKVKQQGMDVTWKCSRSAGQKQQQGWLQVCGETHFGQPVLSLRSALFLLAFKVEPVEFTRDGRQRLPFGLRKEQSDVEGRQKADGGEGHKAELTQLPLEKWSTKKMKVRHDRKHPGWGPDRQLVGHSFLCSLPFC